MRQDSPFAIAAMCGLALIAASPAAAKCTRLAFSVNDYGKEGPTKDAKELLDKYIAQKMAEKGIKQYTVGKKDVTCELFLNLIVVDEHTCKAEATVCWGDSVAPGAAATTAKAPAAPPSAAATAPPAKSAAPATAKAAPPAPAKAAVSPVVTVPTTAETPNAASDTDATAAVPATAPPASAEPKSPDATGGATGTETGAIEKFAAPKKIVIPDPIQVRRGLPVSPGSEDAATEAAVPPEAGAPAP